MKQIAETKERNRCDASSIHLSVIRPPRTTARSRTSKPPTFLSLPRRTNSQSQIGETEAPAALLSFPAPFTREVSGVFESSRVPMALQWMILACVVAVEAAVAALVTLPVPRAVRGQIVALTSLFLQPLSSVIPFAAFQLLDIYWKKEHRLMCTSEICTAEERIRFEKSPSC